MNCDNCGATLRLLEGRDYFRCDHCDTLRFATTSADWIDRVVQLGEADELACPACLTPLTHAALDGARVRACESCRGVLAESDVFAHVTHRRRVNYVGADVLPQPLDPAQFERPRHCPGCAARMETHPYYGPGNVVIDSCAGCSLVWLDYGELSAIERAPGMRTRR